MEESLGYDILSQVLGAQAVLVAISHVSYFSVNNFKGTAVRDLILFVSNYILILLACHAVFIIFTGVF
jgi:hypothetical protein